MATTQRGEVVQKYLKRFPNSPNNTLAKKIFAENKLLFDSEEGARALIRYYRGAHGNASRKNNSPKEYLKPLAFGNQYNLPPSYAPKREFYALPKANNNVLIMSDIHAPYQDNEAITLALNYGKQHKINTVILNGDIIDFCLLSRFEKDPKARNVKEEFDTCRAILVSIRKAFPKADIIWLKGNHDIRYEKWLFLKAPEIFDDSYYLLEERLQLNDLKIKLLDEKILIKAGKLNITHGHLTIRGVFAPVNSARGVYLRTKVSTLISHVHNSSEHTEKDLNDGMVTCWSIGCLCTLSPNYDSQSTKHNTGFAHVTIENNGDYHVQNKRIHNGKIL